MGINSNMKFWTVGCGIYSSLDIYFFFYRWFISQTIRWLHLTNQYARHLYISNTLNTNSFSYFCNKIATPWNTSCGFMTTFFYRMFSYIKQHVSWLFNWHRGNGENVISCTSLHILSIRCHHLHQIYLSRIRWLCVHQCLSVRYHYLHQCLLTIYHIDLKEQSSLKILWRLIWYYIFTFTKWYWSPNHAPCFSTTGQYIHLSD